MTQIASLAAHRAATDAPNVLPFPLTERILRNEARLATARAILRTVEEHDAFTLRMAIAACRDLGTDTDHEVADICETVLNEDASRAAQTAHDFRQIRALDRVIVAAPPAEAVTSRNLQRLTLAAIAIGATIVVLLVAHDAPARVAATVIQAEQLREGW